MAHEGDVVRDDLGALMIDPARRLDRACRLVQRALELACVHQGDRGHRQARHLDPAEAVLAAQLDARPKMPACGEHAAAHVLGIAEAAQRLRLELGGAGHARQLQAALMLGQTALDLAPAGNTDCRAGNAPVQLDREVEPGGQRLGLLQVGERAVQVIDHPLDCREAEQCPAARRHRRRGGERGLIGAHRFRHGAQVLEQLAAQAGQRKALGGARRKRQAPIGQRERLLVAVLARLLARRRQIGRRSTRVFGTIEVLGVQRRVALRKPCGGPPVQLAPSGLEQRVVDGIADQRVREQEPVAGGAHEKALDQGGAA